MPRTHPPYAPEYRLARGVVDPGEGGCRRAQREDVFVRHHHHATPLERLADRQAGMRGMGEARPRVYVRQHSGLRDILDVEDEKAR